MAGRTERVAFQIQEAHLSKFFYDLKDVALHYCKSPLEAYAYEDYYRNRMIWPNYCKLKFILNSEFSWSVHNYCVTCLDCTIKRGIHDTVIMFVMQLIKYFNLYILILCLSCGHKIFLIFSVWHILWILMIQDDR